MKHKKLSVVLAGLVLFGIAGCSGPDALEDGSDPVWAESFSACMSERGWTVTISADGGVGGEYPEAQEDVFRNDSIECSTGAGSGVKPTEEQFEVGYSALVENRECLVDQGYDLPGAPSYQAWREIHGRWNPYVDLPATLSTSELEKLIESCPPPET